MEKISIVKRRKKAVQETGEGSNNPADKDNQVFTFNLTPQQQELVKSSSHIKTLMDKAADNPALDVQQREDGHIVFKFNLEKMETVKMLKSEHVCQMLQISKSLLARLVREKKIKSYKVGRLRRFSLEDILAYLTENEDYRNSEM